MKSALILIAATLAVHLPHAQAQPAQPSTTYNRDIAPILYHHCTSCHHQGGSGPFPLMSFADAHRWGTLAAEVTQRRYMPPWLPSNTHGTFADDRRLSPQEIALIQRWSRIGMPQGDPAGAPTPPRYTSDWQLGPPDLIVEMDTATQVPASGTDLFRNFIFPVTLAQSRWVRAMEIKPTGEASASLAVVHHANLAIDRTGSLRRSHPADWKLGIPGMDVLVDAGNSFDPDSHFLYWKPDSSALVEPAAQPWRLDPGNDLVLNMHLKPTGKPETIRARIGLYFTPTPATQLPILFQLENDAALNIPPGTSSFPIEDSLKLPTAVDLLAIYPHAHYLAKHMEGWAILPTGQRRSLIEIPDWDIDRQSIYRYSQPIFLPAGTVVHMRYTYDNSAANPHNPNSPPIRVTSGNRSLDEMGHLWLQVLPHPSSAAKSDPRAPILRAWMEHRLQKDPNDPVALFNVASLDMSDGAYPQAATLFRRSLAARPPGEHTDELRTLTALASATDKSGDWTQARTILLQALALDPTDPDALFDLAAIDLQHNDSADAELRLRTLIAHHPQDAPAHATLGSLMLAADRLPEAQSQFEAALTADPHNATALYNLALIEASNNHPDSALPHAKAAEDASPEDPDIHHLLADLYARRADLPAAIREQRLAIAATPRDPALWNELGELDLRAGNRASARADFEHALTLDPTNKTAHTRLLQP